MTTPYDDPFAGSNKFPSISFKDAPVGTTVDVIVKSAPKLVQSRDFDTGDPAVWPDGNPKMAVVIEVELNGDMHTVWAAKPSAMFQALADAQTQAGQRIEPGGRLRITYAGEVPNSKNPRLNPAKQYRCVYAPNDPFAGAPEWAAPQQSNLATLDQRPAAGYPVPPPNPLAPAPPPPATAAPAAAVDGGVDPAVLAALKNLNPEILAQLANQGSAS